MVAQGPILPFETGYDPKFKSEFGDYDPARARALLDLYGYKDRNGDGWREMPDGSPIVLNVATTPNGRDRKIAEVLDKDMRLLGIHVVLKVAQWPENLRMAQAGTLQVWSLGGYASAPDPDGAFARFDSRQVGGQNMARVRLPKLDALYRQIQLLPDGPERQAAMDDATKLAIAYMPYKYTVSRLSIDMTYPQLVGYRRPVVLARVVAVRGHRQQPAQGALK